MLYILILITTLILTFSVYLFLMSFKHAAAIAGYIGVQKNSVLPKYIFGITALVFFGILFLFLMQLNDYETKKNLLSIPKVLTTTQTVSLPGFQQLLVETYPQTQNYYFLYTGIDKSEATLATMAKNIRKNSCTIACTINFYDDMQAFTVDRERVNIIDPAKMVAWNMQNYTFVADHYLGYLNSAQYPSFEYYPYKDAYYQELLKNKK